ncbi:MAG: transposase [Burkholderiales bacterium]|nr:transposase [Burkholderiales bacterium]
MNIGSDMNEMVPMHEQIRQRYGHTPGHWLADGGYTKLQAFDEVAKHGTQPLMPPPRSRDPNIDPFASKSTDSAHMIQWRVRMASEQGKELYKQRAATVECTNAQVRRRGLRQFLVRGLAKARCVLLWHAMAHNLMRMRSLNLAWQP